MKQLTRVSRDGLTPKQRAFVLEYVANGWNATRAYLASHPDCESYHSAAVSAFQCLRNPKVQTYLRTAEAKRWKQLELSAEQAMGLISLRADPDLASAYDDEGKLLAFHLWPRDLQRCVRKISPSGEVLLYDGLKAAELMAVAHGRLRAAVDVRHTFDHRGYLAGLDNPEGPK